MIVFVLYIRWTARSIQQIKDTQFVMSSGIMNQLNIGSMVLLGGSLSFLATYTQWCWIRYIVLLLQPLVLLDRIIETGSQMNMYVYLHTLTLWLLHSTYTLVGHPQRCCVIVYSTRKLSKSGIEVRNQTPERHNFYPTSFCEVPKYLWPHQI